MEDYIREKTDALGFCRHHYKMMYDYGNRLGSALILSTHLKKLNTELEQELKGFVPGKPNGLRPHIRRRKRLWAHGLTKKNVPAMYAIILTRFTIGIWIPFLICTVRTKTFVNLLLTAKDFVCRIFVI